MLSEIKIEDFNAVIGGPLKDILAKNQQSHEVELIKIMLFFFIFSVMVEKNDRGDRQRFEKASSKD